MKKIIYSYFIIFSIIVIIIILLNNIKAISNAKIVPYDSKIFNGTDSTQIEPYQFYNLGTITLLTREEVEIDIGFEDRIHLGFVYNVYQKEDFVGQIIITEVMNEYSKGIIYDKNKDFIEGDRIVFSGMIDVDTNLSYKRRVYQKITTKVNFIDDSGICFLEGNKNSGITKKMRFNIIDSNGNNTGLVEIIDDTGKDNIIVTQVIINNKIKIGDNAVNQPRDSAQWLEFASKLEKDEKILSDTIFAYEMALKTGGEPKNYLKNKLIILVSQKANILEKNEEFEKALKLYKKILGFAPETDNIYDEIKNKVQMLAREYWNARSYLSCIKFYEVLNKDEQTIKYLSLSYNGLGMEMIKSNTELAIYCFEKAIKLLPSNQNAWKKLIEIYEKKGEFEKSIELLENFSKNNIEEAEKKWIIDSLNNIKLRKENILPNINFRNLDGKSMNLISLRGNFVLILFWSRYNRYSLENLTYINNYMEKEEDLKLKVLVFNNDDTDENIINNFFEEKKLLKLTPIFIQEEQLSLLPNPDVTNKPFYNILLNPSGKIIYQGENIEEIEKYLENLE